MKTAAQNYLTKTSRWVYEAPQHVVRRTTTFPDLPRGVVFTFVRAAVFLLVALISYFIQDEYQKAYEQLKQQGLLDEDSINYGLHPLAAGLGLGWFAAMLWPMILWGALILLHLSLCVPACFMRAIEYVGSLLGFHRAFIDQAPGALLIGGAVATCLWLGFLILY